MARSPKAPSKDIASPPTTTPTKAEQLLQELEDPTDPLVAAKVSKLLARVSMSRSPYPSPKMLAEYESFSPGFADKIIAKIDKETDHRHALELQSAKGDEARKTWGQIFGFIVALIGLAIAGGIVWIAPENWIVASVIALVSVGGPPVASILARIIDKIHGS